MPRIRTIKPEFFMDEDLAELSIAARLSFPAIWTLADREGRLEDRPKRIKAQILPYDSVEMDALLQELHDGGFIKRYQANGISCIQVVNFLRHQIPGRDEPPSEIPSEDGVLVAYIKPPNDTVRNRLYERDGFQCAYCQTSVKENSRQRCLDHVIPYAHGGSNAEENLVTSCKKCNDKKRDRTPAEAGFPWPAGRGAYADGTPVNPPLTPRHDPVIGLVTGKGMGKELEEIGKGSAEGKPQIVAPPLLSTSKEESPPVTQKIPELDFWTEFVLAYPKRSGSLNRAAAEPIFRKYVKAGVDPALIVAGARKYRLWALATEKIGTEWVAQMTTWLNQKRWVEDFDIPTEARGSPNGRRSEEPTLRDTRTIGQAT